MNHARPFPSIAAPRPERGTALGLLHRLRCRLAAARPQRPSVGPTPADLDTLRRALTREAARRGRRQGLTVALFMEHTDLDLSALDLYAILGILQAQGEITNVEPDSFGNLKFDLTDRPRPPG